MSAEASVNICFQSLAWVNLLILTFDCNNFPGCCELEGLTDCVCLDGESCWHGVNVIANVNPAILDTVIV